MFTRSQGLGAAIAAVMVLATGASPAVSQMGSVCPSPWLAARIPSGTQVQLLAAAGNTIPGERRGIYRKMDLAVFSCLSPSSAIVVRPINATSFTEVTLFDESAPGPDSNGLRRNAAVQAFVERAAAAIDKLPERGKSDLNSDPLGALQAAGQDLNDSPDAKHVVIMVFNGWQQSRDFNIFVYHHNPAEFIDPVLHKMRDSGATPKLTGADVMIFGLVPGPRDMGTTLQQVNGLCSFWTAIVKESGGTLVRCSGGMPGVSD